MSNKNTAWLCNYRDRHFFDIYGIRATFPEILEAKIFYHLDKKDDEKILSESENVNTNLKLTHFFVKSPF